MQAYIAEVQDILGRWALAEADQLVVLCLPTNCSLTDIGSMQKPELDQVLARGACITSLDRSLNILYASQYLIRRWLSQPNSHSYFINRTALDVLKSDDLEKIRQVTHLMAAWSAGNY